MSFQPIGFVTVLAGIACFAFGPSVSIPVFLCVTLLGASAAAFLTALGGANIQPAHLLLAFLLADLVCRPRMLHDGVGCFRFPNPGFWLLLTVCYGTAATIIMPRLFAGVTYVFTPARLDSGTVSILSVPLAPSSANLTQSIYFIGDALCFLVFYAFGSRARATRDFIRGVIICGFLNIGFAVLDLATYYTGTAEYLSFIRNSSYRMLDDTETAGLKRIVGSFTEASTFAYITLGLLAFNLRLWSEGIRPRLTGSIAFFSIIAIAFATSSTGYAGLAVFLGLQFVLAIRRLLQHRASPNSVMFLGIAPVACCVMVGAIALNPQLVASVTDLIDTTLFNKLSSDSGVERGAWNRQAIASIHDTMWLGAGIGSLRASSWLLAVPANIGAFGAFTYGSFVLAVLFKRHDDDNARAAVRAGARDACLVQLVAASIAGSFIDLGLSFFVFAGMASSRLRDRSADAMNLRKIQAPIGAGRHLALPAQSERGV